MHVADDWPRLGYFLPCNCLERSHYIMHLIVTVIIT